MKRHAAFLGLAALALAALTGGYNSGARPSLSSSINAEYPWSGTLVITVDDGLNWVYTDLIDSLRVVNADSGLTGTPWEMKANVFANIWNDNGLLDWQGQTGTSGCTAGGPSVCRMNAAQLRACENSGLIEVGGHGANHFAMDPYSSAGQEVKGAFGAADSGTVEWQIAQCYHALVDSIGLRRVYSFVTPNHRLDNQALFVLGKYFRNARAGCVFNANHGAAGSGEWPDADGTTGSNNRQRGTNLGLNRLNMDPWNYWWFNYDPVAQFNVGPTFPMNRLYLPHNANMYVGGHTAANVDTCLARTKRAITQAAESKGLCIITWHDQNNFTPGILPDYTYAADSTGSGSNGMVGVMRILRYAAHYARNGALARDRPKLQVMFFNDAMNKRSSLAYLDGAVNCVDNIRLLPDSVSQLTAGGRFEVPYGYPHRLAIAGGAWADSGWGYVDPDSAMAHGGWFPFDCNDDSTGAAAQRSGLDSARATGLFTARKTTDANFKGLVQVLPVIPGSRAFVWCYAWTSMVNDATGDSTASDSLSACWINPIITPLGPNFDPSDTTDAWTQVAIATTPSAGFIRVHATDPFNAYSPSGDYSGGATATDSNGYVPVRFQGRFHMRDGSFTLRSAGYSNPTYTGIGTAISTADDRGQRWRQFSASCNIPEDSHYIRVVFQPVGWNNTGSAAESLAVTMIEAQCTPR